ncbi:MAG: hypothetical protein ACK2TT_05205 [Anaerolineales bacterium]
MTDALETADDQVGDFRVPTKHPQQVEPLPDRDPSGESAQIPGDSTDLELREEQERPSYDPTLEPEPAGDTGEAPGGESNSRSKTGEEAVGKAAFGEPAADPANSYSGVEMSQGEVAQDSDWNEGSRTGDEMVLETDPTLEEQAGLPKYLKDSSFQIAEQLEDSAEGSGKLTLGDLVLSVLPWPFHKDLPEPSGELGEGQNGMYDSLSVPVGKLTGEDTTSETEADQDISSVSFPLPDGNEVEVKAIPLPGDISTADNQPGESDDDGESQVSDTSEVPHLREVQPPAPEGSPQDASEDARLANLELQNQLQRQQQTINMLQGIASALQDTVRDIDNNIVDGSSHSETGGSAAGKEAVSVQSEEALQEIGDQTQLEMIDLQNGLQRQQQYIQMMSNISKMMEDTAMSVIRKTSGDGESARDDPGQASDSGQDQESTMDTPSDMSDMVDLFESLEDSMQNTQQAFQATANILRSIHDADTALIENIRGAEGQEEETPGSSGDELQKELEEWEEKLSSIGDDAQLTEVDLSSFLEKQQSTIEMLSGMTKTLTDTTSVVAQKMGLTQPPSLEAVSQETGTQGGSLQEELASEGRPADWQSIAMANGIDDPRTGDAVGIIVDQPEDTEGASTSSGSDQSSGTDELRDRLSNLEATRHRLEMDINSLRDFIAHTPEGQFQILLIHLPVPDGQGGYHLVPMQVPADVNGAANLLHQQEGVLSQIMAEIAQVQGQLESCPAGQPNQSGGSVQGIAASNQDSDWRDIAQDNGIENPRLDPN